MSTNTLVILVLSTFLILNFPGLTRSDCPYPCYPPPTGSGDQPPATLTPPSSQSGDSYPPPAGYDTPGTIPNYPSPPYGGGSDGGGGGGFYGPPPPDPILPYFPFYYRKPPHKPEGSVSAAAAVRGKSTVWIAAAANLVALVFLGASLPF